MAGEGYRLSEEWHPGEKVERVVYVVGYEALKTFTPAPVMAGEQSMRSPEDAGLTIMDLD